MRLDEDGGASQKLMKRTDENMKKNVIIIDITNEKAIIELKTESAAIRKRGGNKNVPQVTALKL